MKSDRKSGDTNNPDRDAKKPLIEKSDQTKRTTHKTDQAEVDPKNVAEDYKNRESDQPKKDWQKETPNLKPKTK